jgi:Flavin containing amine oxidoreductase
MTMKPDLADPRDPSRRQTIKYLIAGAAAAACPIPSFAGELNKQLGGEENQLCHQVRDGASFKFPEPSEHKELVIVGGGPSGLIASYRLRDSDFLLLEKEPRLGGNAISEQWRGVWYSTGAAYQMDDGIEKLCGEIGLPINRIRSVDAAIINDQVVPEFWGEGLSKAPYPDSVKKNWAKFFADMKALDTEKNAEKLDNVTFAELLQPYGAEVIAFFDNFGPNNWGGRTRDTSALIGAQSVTWGGGLDPNRFTWPGGLGRISLALEAALNKAAPANIRTKATVLQVEPKGTTVNVSYSEGQEIRTVAAKAVIMACPKFIAKKLVKGLNNEQYEAMAAERYQPYVVANVCLNRVVYNGSYDTNIPYPSTIVDFNVADWVENRDNKNVNRPSVLTCYVPRPESQRSRLLDDSYVLGLGETVVELLNRWFPGSKQYVEEVHLYRRGHPMYVSAPGVLTRIAPKVRKPMGNIFFAHSDSEGGISEYSSALRAADRSTAELKAYLGEQSKRAVAAGR